MFIGRAALAIAGIFGLSLHLLLNDLGQVVHLKKMDGQRCNETDFKKKKKLTSAEGLLSATLYNSLP